MPGEKPGADHEQESQYQLIEVNELQVGDVVKGRGEIISITESSFSPSWVIIHHTGGVMSVSKGARIWAIKAEQSES